MFARLYSEVISWNPGSETRHNRNGNHRRDRHRVIVWVMFFRVLWKTWKLGQFEKFRDRWGKVWDFSCLEDLYFIFRAVIIAIFLPNFSFCNQVSMHLVRNSTCLPISYQKFSLYPTAWILCRKNCQEKSSGNFFFCLGSINSVTTLCTRVTFCRRTSRWRRRCFVVNTWTHIFSVVPLLFPCSELHRFRRLFSLFLLTFLLTPDSLQSRQCSWILSLEQSANGRQTASDLSYSRFR